MPEPVFVAKSWDEMLLAVKSQSNLVIARCLRKLFKQCHISLSFKGIVKTRMNYKSFYLYYYVS